VHEFESQALRLSYSQGRSFVSWGLGAYNHYGALSFKRIFYNKNAAVWRPTVLPRLLRWQLRSWR